MDKITFCIPSKNNLRYLKTCLPSIRKNAYRQDHDIIVFVDSDNDGTVEWLKENHTKYNVTYYVNPDLGKSLFGIGKAYDYCIEKSQTEICMIFHADMMLGKHADLEAFNLLEKGVVVCATRIEPPLHPNAGEKVLQDFGLWPEEFKESEFDSCVEELKILYKDKITMGIFAPWMIYRQDLLDIQGHDPILLSAREDSDIFNRMKLNGYELKQSWRSYVYHLTGRGGQFQHGEITNDEQKKSDEWRKLMENSTKEFIRKWGTTVKHDDLMDPIISPKFDIAYIVHNCTNDLLKSLELFCDNIFTNLNYDEYIQEEQKNTKFNLKKRLKSLTDEVQNDVVIEFDATKLNSQNFNILQLMPEILKDSGSQGIFEIDIFIVKIKQLVSYESELIKLDSSYYKNKLS